MIIQLSRARLRETWSKVVRRHWFLDAYDPIGNRMSATYYDEQGEAVASAYAENALNQYTQRTVPGTAQVRGFADEDAEVTVNGNGTWRGGEYFYGGDDADNAAFPVFQEVEIAAVVPASSPDGWDEMSAVTGLPVWDQTEKKNYKYIRQRASFDIALWHELAHAKDPYAGHLAMPSGPRQKQFKSTDPRKYIKNNDNIDKIIRFENAIRECLGEPLRFPFYNTAEEIVP